MFESFLRRVSKRDSKSAKSKKAAIDKNPNPAPMELSSFRPLRCSQAPKTLNGMEQQHVYDEINDNAYVYVFEANEISGQITATLPLKNSLDSSEDSTGSSSSACSSLSTRGNSKRVHFPQIEKQTFEKKFADLKPINTLRSTNSILKKSSPACASSSSSSCSSRLSSSSIPSSSNSVASDNNFDELVEHFVTRLMCKTRGTHNCNICNKYLSLSDGGSNAYSVCVNQVNGAKNSTVEASESANKFSCRVTNLTLEDLKKRKKLMDSA